jgi:hypothetical protein
MTSRSLARGDRQLAIALIKSLFQIEAVRMLEERGLPRMCCRSFPQKLARSHRSISAYASFHFTALQCSAGVQSQANF